MDTNHNGSTGLSHHIRNTPLLLFSIYEHISLSSSVYVRLSLSLSGHSCYSVFLIDLNKDNETADNPPLSPPAQTSKLVETKLKVIPSFQNNPACALQVLKDRRLCIPARGSPDLIHILHVLRSRPSTRDRLRPAHLRWPDASIVCTLMWNIYMTVRSRGDLGGETYYFAAGIARFWDWRASMEISRTWVDF